MAQQKIADYTTPLVRNCWYVAALADEVTRELKERTLLGKTLLMYRTLVGAPVFMQNRCAHRSFPLSKGRLDGDRVVCGYHGMEYNPQGQCVFMPSLAKEQQGSIHYWWFNSRDFALDDESASEYLAATSNQAYQEDVDALGWIQQELEKESEAPEGLSFGPDRPGLAMRKILLRLARQEAGAGADAAAV